MPVGALNFQDVVRNIKVSFFSQENIVTLYMAYMPYAMA